MSPHALEMPARAVVFRKNDRVRRLSVVGQMMHAEFIRSRAFLQCFQRTTVVRRFVLRSPGGEKNDAGHEEGMWAENEAKSRARARATREGTRTPNPCGTRS